jgi:hypothetical protein
MRASLGAGGSISQSTVYGGQGFGNQGKGNARRSGNILPSALIRGQECSPCGGCESYGNSGYDVWFQGFTANMKAWSDGDNVAGNEGYNATRNGAVLGISTSLDSKTVAGLIFGLSNPYMYADGSIPYYIYYQQYGVQKVDLTDFQFGGQIQTQLANDWELAFYIGGGSQKGDFLETWDLIYNNQAFPLQRYAGDYRGNTLTSTLALSKVLRINKYSVLRPVVGIDVEHAWYYSFTEVEKLADEAVMHQYRTHYGRTMARIGLMAQTGRDRWGLNGRIFYAGQLGGKDYAVARQSPTAPDGHVVDPTDIIKTNSIRLGRDMVTIGTGGHFILNRKKTLVAFTDYNVNLFKYATTQIISAGLQKTF